MIDKSQTIIGQTEVTAFATGAYRKHDDHPMDCMPMGWPVIKIRVSRR